MMAEAEVALAKEEKSKTAETKEEKEKVQKTYITRCLHLCPV